MKESIKANKETMSFPTNENDFAIQIFSITKKFGDLVSVDNIDLSIKKGEMFSLLGPNGAGKTTIIRILCCLLKPTDDTVTIMGYDIKKDPLSVKGIIDVSPQETAIAGHLNTWENLALMGGVHGLSKEETKRRVSGSADLMLVRLQRNVKSVSPKFRKKLLDFKRNFCETSDTRKR